MSAAKKDPKSVNKSVAKAATPPPKKNEKMDKPKSIIKGGQKKSDEKPEKSKAEPPPAPVKAGKADPPKSLNISRVGEKTMGMNTMNTTRLTQGDNGPPEYVIELTPTFCLEYKAPFTERRVQTLTIRNTTEKKLTFKLKCTNRERFKASPVSGNLDEKASIKIEISCKPFECVPPVKQERVTIVFCFGKVEPRQMKPNDCTKKALPVQYMNEKGEQIAVENSGNRTGTPGTMSPGTPADPKSAVPSSKFTFPAVKDKEPPSKAVTASKAESPKSVKKDDKSKAGPPPPGWKVTPDAKKDEKKDEKSKIAPPPGKKEEKKDEKSKIAPPPGKKEEKKDEKSKIAPPPEKAKADDKSKIAPPPAKKDDKPAAKDAKDAGKKK